MAAAQTWKCASLEEVSTKQGMLYHEKVEGLSMYGDFALKASGDPLPKPKTEDGETSLSYEAHKRTWRV